MIFKGNLKKMKTESLTNSDINYSLVGANGSNNVLVNDLIGKSLKISFQGVINCIKCGNETKKSFGQGFCYKCFISAPETEDCVLRPELCRAHEGVARDMEFAKNHCLIDHFVYLAVASGLKVGVTRHTQIPTRWIDQGASYAIRLAKTPNRYTAGLIEVALKDHMSDKTNWRKMLTNQIPDIDLVEEKGKIEDFLPFDLRNYISDDDEIIHLNYPVTGYPEKVQSLNLDKAPVVSGVLTGIRGQYLIFNGGKVLNIRKHSGYLVEVENE